LRVNSRPYELELALFFCAALAVRVFLPPPFLDLFIPYTASSGFIAFKIHPGTYLIVVAALFEIARSDMRALIDMRKHAPLLILCAATAFAALTSLAQGRTQAVGYLIDSIICGALAGWIVTRLAPQMRQYVLVTMVALMGLNTLVSLFEYITHNRIMPFRYNEATFRPTAFLGHPLDNGLITLTIMMFTPALRWPFAVRLGLMTFFLLGVFISGARASTLIACLFYLLAFIAMMRSESQRNPRTAGMVLVGVLAAVVIAPILLMSGLADALLYRFEGGVVDKSTMTRIDIFGVLRYISFQELMLGSNIDKLHMLSRVYLNNGAVESPIVMMIFQFGLVVMVVLFGAIMYSVLRMGMARHMGLLAALAFLLSANTNNVLNVKSPALSFVFALLCVLPLKEIVAAPLAPARAPRRLRRPTDIGPRPDTTQPDAPRPQT
jgi:hypothetical protein